MTCSKLNEMLFDRFPNLQEKYIDEVSWQDGDDTGSHTVYGDVLTPYLVDCISRGNKQEFQVVVDFLEKLLELEDKYVDEVVSFSVLESSAYLFNEKAYLISCLGEKCKKALHDVM